MKLLNKILTINNLYSSDLEDVKNKELYKKILNERLRIIKANNIPLIVQDSREYNPYAQHCQKIKPDVIIHLAAVSHSNKSNKDPHTTFDNSLRTLENTLDIAKLHKTQVIYLSSSMVYGDFKSEKVSETEHCDPIGIYGNLKLAGEELPVLNPTIKSAKGGKNDFSRTTFKYLDVGTLPEGSGGEDDPKGQQQIEKAEEENSNPAKILNQAIMRLNQMNNFKISITLPGDFTLHAGDTVFVDSPMLDAGKKIEQQTEVDNQSGGLYIIRDLCHFMSAESTYTKINVVRDSVGRKGTAENG